MVRGARKTIRFLLNGQDIELEKVAPGVMLLDFLRLDKGLRGTKEGCAEGDCGACTVLVGRLSHGKLIYESMTACIRLLASLDGCHVVTIEGLGWPDELDGSLNVVQQAMVDEHGSQCGFCTPGVVMSLQALLLANPHPSEADIETSLQGNLCRCTGYAPIVRAGLAAAASDISTTDPLIQSHDDISSRLAALRDGRRVDMEASEGRIVLPADVDDLAEFLADEPEARIVAGATDVGLWVTKHFRDISPVVLIGHLDGLREVDIGANTLTLGAGVSYCEAAPALLAKFPQLKTFWERIGGVQVRNAGTIGGNIANGSPIGDTPPPLIVLGATLLLRKGKARRRLPLEDYFIAYGQQDRSPGEFIESVSIPFVPEGEIFAVYKISKRRDEDISALSAAFRVGFDHAGRISSVKVAFGGMAATPKRALAVEKALLGQSWNEATIEMAADAVAEDFAPISDVRASAEYRLAVAQNLVRRFYLESTGAEAQLSRGVV